MWARVSSSGDVVPHQILFRCLKDRSSNKVFGDAFLGLLGELKEMDLATFLAELQAANFTLLIDTPHRHYM